MSFFHRPLTPWGKYGITGIINANYQTLHGDYFQVQLLSPRTSLLHHFWLVTMNMRARSAGFIVGGARACPPKPSDHLSLRSMEGV